ncbi:CsiV family protein [Psychromonas sp. KJ10-10]|uniref:CsiV family protein n=1 Tax=Psychromonas sp. KJ10-10 TaxID=3391823 RepID=UPI0039B38A00
MLGPQLSKPLHLFAGENFAFKYPSQELGTGADKWAIDGNFKIYLNHFLYVDSQLIIRKEMTQEIVQPPQAVEVINDENGVQIASPTNLPLNDTPPAIIKQRVLKEILFDQNRRLRSEEIHYLDHPLMGIIIQIRKIP